jgi:hypothetical protein
MLERLAVETTQRRSAVTTLVMTSALLAIGGAAVHTVSMVRSQGSRYLPGAVQIGGRQQHAPVKEPVGDG